MTPNHISLNKPNKNFEIWHFITFLLPLLLVTVSVVAIILHTWVARESNVIDLIPQDESAGDDTDTRIAGEISRETLVIREDDSDADTDTDSDSTFISGGEAEGSSGADSYTTSNSTADTGSGNSVSNPTWQTTTSVDLFKSVYTNDAGEVTVKSSDGDKVVAPGTSNDYDFSLKNTGNVSLNYTLDLNQSFTIKDSGIPFLIRLKRGSTWLVGSADKWEEPEELDKLVEKGTLGVNCYVTYTLEWQWPFDSDSKDDTLLGNKAALQDISFKLDIITKATADTVGGTAGSSPGSTSGVNESVAADTDREDEDLSSIAENALDRTKSFIVSHFNPQEETDEVSFPVNMLLLAAAMCFLMLLVHRMEKVHFTGYIKNEDGKTMERGLLKLKLGRRNILSTPLSPDNDGWFEFRNITMGKRILIMENIKGDAVASKVIRIKRRLLVHGVQIEDNGKSAVIKLGSSVSAIELCVLKLEGAPYMYIDTENWSAMDKQGRPCVLKEEETKNVKA